MASQYYQLDYVGLLLLLTPLKGSVVTTQPVGRTPCGALDSAPGVLTPPAAAAPKALTPAHFRELPQLSHV
jgi:hypothetical protein